MVVVSAPLPTKRTSLPAPALRLPAMRIVAATATLLALAGTTTHAQTNYYADLGQYGTFEMEVSADDGTMKWSSSLKNIDQLQTQLNVTISSLTYHLHQQWTNADSDVAIGGAGCSANITGGHYDPFFGCGPASGIPTDQCLAIGKARNATRYNCTPAVFGAARAYHECEVGDLSGKHGPIAVLAGGIATSTRVTPDPLPAIAAQYVTGRTVNTADKFASIVYHIGSPRVLCGKLFEGTLPSLPTPAPVITVRPTLSPIAAPVAAPFAAPAMPVATYPTVMGPKMCGIEYFLYDADTDGVVLGPLLTDGSLNVAANNITCDDNFSYNIGARPTGPCAAATGSVRLAYTAPGSTVRKSVTESTAPYLLFGNEGSDIFGRRNLPDGAFRISATLFAGRSGRGAQLYTEAVEIVFSCE